MNDQQLSQALTQLVADRKHVAPTPALSEKIWAIPEMTTRQRSWLPSAPKWRFGSMFSATKFVVAGAIVALFGGFLLAGVLTQPSEEMVPAAVTDSPSPAMIEALLSGMVTEEVEPGVYRVLSDDAGHDLVAEPPGDVTVAPDGSVWLLRGASIEPGWPIRDHVDAVYRLGLRNTHPFDPADPSYAWFTDFAVDARGHAWVKIGDGATLGNFDGSSWMAPTWPDGSAGVAGIESSDDGSVWVTQTVEDGPGPRVARIINGEWTVLPPLEAPTLAGYFHGAARYFAAATDGTAWLANGNFHAFDSATSAPQGLLHFDGTGWQVMDLPVDDPSTWKAGPLALGSDGTLWVFLEPNTGQHLACRPGQLARFSEDEWSLFEHRPHHSGSSRPNRVPPIVCGQGPEASLAVDGEGRLWVAAYEDGVRSFDGTTWQHYLTDLHVNRMGVLPDGSVIATALYACPGSDTCSGLHGDPTKAGLYVITPEGA